MSKVIKSFDPQSDGIPLYERSLLEEIVPVVEEPVEEEVVDLGPTPEEILEEARAEAERVVREAYAEGHRRGTEAGHAEYLQSVGQSAETLRGAADAMRAARERFIASLEPQIIALVKDIARRVLRRELKGDEELLRSTVRAVLGNLADREQVTLRVNPADLDVLRREKVSLLEEFDAVERMEIVGDESIAQGGCVAETETLHVDARLDAQLERILDALTE